MNTSRHVISSYGGLFADQSPHALQPKNGFSGANVIRMTGMAGDFCLRQWPAPHPVETRIRGLHLFLRHLSQQKLKTIPSPIANTSGSTLTRINDRLWQLEPWMNGSADFHDNPNQTRLFAAMTEVAAIHDAAQTFQCPPQLASWFGSKHLGSSPSCVERAEILNEWLSGRINRVKFSNDNDSNSEFRDTGRLLIELTQQVGPYILRSLKDGLKLRVPLQPCFRDLWHDHVLFTNDRVTGVIDPASTRTSSVASDLSRLLGSLVGDDVHAFATALDHYATCRPLSNHERSLVTILDQSSILLSALTWLRRRYSSNGSANSIDWERVLIRLRGFESRLRNLANRIA